MAVRKATRKATKRITLKRKRRRLKGGNAADFFAGFAAPFKAGYHLIKGDHDAAIKDFTDLGPRLSQGFTGHGRKRRRC